MLNCNMNVKVVGTEHFVQELSPSNREKLKESMVELPG